MKARSVKLVYSGNNYFEVLGDLIAGAKENIHLQTYIWDNDVTGLRVAEALQKAAARGVKVYALADAFGSSALDKDFIAELKRAGVHFRMYSPLFSSESNLFTGGLSGAAIRS